MTHTFDTKIAKEYGIEEAIILQNIFFWIQKNRANGKHYYDGAWWTYNSVKAFSDLFEYMTSATIRRVLEKLEKQGVIASGSYNKVSYDRTKWYSLTEKGLVLFDESICQFNQFDLSKVANGIVKSSKPIPDINTDDKPNVNSDEETQSEITTPHKRTNPKHKHGEYSHVLLADEEHAKLAADFPDLPDRIRRLDEYIQMKGAKYKDHALTIRLWARNDGERKPYGKPLAVHTRTTFLDMED